MAITPLPPFADGQTIAVVGDSITHNGSWHRFLADYYLCRFPERRLRFVNLGVSGDSCAGALARLDWDISRYRADYVVVMFGMNDVNRGLYAADRQGAEVEAARQAALAAYRRNLAQLLAALDRLFTPAQRVVCSPTIYDEYVDWPEPRLPGCDSLGLAQAAALAEAVAGEAGWSFFPMREAFLARTRREQQRDPAFSFVGRDRVHPLPEGHFLMASAWLQAQGLAGDYPAARLDASGRPGPCQRCRLFDAAAQPGRLAFTMQTEQLPFVLTPDSFAALFAAELAALNRQTLTVTGLAAGQWQLRCGPTPLVVADAAAWAAGGDLAALPEAPDRSQAAAVVSLDCERHRQVCERIRNPAAARFFVGLERQRLNALGQPLPADEFAAAEALLPLSQPFFQGLYRSLLTYGPPAAAAEVEAGVRELEERIDVAKRPQAHRYELVRLD